MADFSEYGGRSDEWSQVEATLPKPPDLDIQELKRTTNQTRENAAREGMKALASQVSLQDHSFAARDGTQLAVRSYRPSSVEPSQILPIYLHFSGGGFLFGTLDSEDLTCSLTAINAGVVVVSVFYRHTPEFTYPTAWNDAEDTFDWTYDHASLFGGDNQQIVVGGISAGGQLTAALMQTLQRKQSSKRHSVRGQVLMIPTVVHPKLYQPFVDQLRDPSVSSYVENQFAPLLPVSRINMFLDLLFPAIPDVHDRRASPGLASPEEVASLPPATFGIAGLDPLRDEGLLYAKLLQDNGVPTNVHVFKGVPHAFRAFGDRLKVSKAWDQVLHGGIQWALKQPQATPKLDIHVH